MAVYRISERKRGIFSSFSVTSILITINIIVWLIILFALSINPDFIKYFALQPSLFIQGGYMWTILVSMFSHIFFWHIFANMITLLFIGGFIERILGKKRYLIFYLVSGIIASLLFVFLSVLFGNSFWGERIFGSPQIFALGASGAIFGLAGVITILMPRIKVLVFFIVPMPMWIAMVFFLGFFWVLSAFSGLPIGNSAHFGGFLVGMAYGLYLKNKYPRKISLIQRHFS
jgi:hypothetical protein